MARTGKDYRNLLASLLPKGKAWNTEEGSIILKLLYGLGEEFARVEARALSLLNEKDLSTTSELITEHEEDFGLPEEGFDLASTTEKRREELTESLRKVGEQNSAYYEELALALGYVITIEQYTPFWAGIATAGDPCGGQNNLFYWTVLIDADSVDEPAEVNISKLIQKIKNLKPAHTMVLFRFNGIEFGPGFSRAFDRVPTYDNSWGLLGEKELDFNNEFSSAFANNTDYDGVNYTGAFNKGFAISFDRYSGGAFFTDEFGDGFSQAS